MRNISNPNTQRGFFAIGIGIALLAVFAGTSIGIKHVAQSDQKEIATVAQNTPADEAAPTGLAFAYNESGE
ncbi:MAG: hypothetical protein OES09_08105 [Gammaproteobacteria bacterium]|nr:hypothetical protein [Gammaproteobacteria bacterium]